ncbi:hypothetical protein SNEBB_001609 [Seison nebaliae]|nr:hypothetical protein SNEBB_001609 [Seison nebaliae]
MSKTNFKNPYEKVINKQWRLKELLGSGSFGDVYTAVHESTGDVVAVKFEPLKEQLKQLQYEFRVFKLLQNGIGIPAVYHYGEFEKWNIMIMERLRISLEDLFEKLDNKFSLKTILMLGDQMVTRLEFLHSRDILHRDIKPDNFMMGLDKHAKRVYIIDFGLAKKFYDQKNGHLPFREGKSLTGTPRYASINAHVGYEQSRRDDLEALGYVLLYFHLGRLPWQGLKAVTHKQKYAKIKEMKQAISTKALCKNAPEVFATFLDYAKNLEYEQKPDYHYIRQQMRDLFRAQNFVLDFIYDWDGDDTAPTTLDLDQMAHPVDAHTSGARATAGEKSNVTHGYPLTDTRNKN